MKLAGDLTCLMLCPLPQRNPTSGVVDTYNSQIRVSHFLLFSHWNLNLSRFSYIFPHLPSKSELLPSFLLLPTANSRSQWALPGLIRDISGHCRTPTASSRSQWALPDLNCVRQISVGTAGIWRSQLRSGSAHVKENVRINARQSARIESQIECQKNARMNARIGARKTARMNAT